MNKMDKYHTCPNCKLVGYYDEVYPLKVVTVDDVDYCETCGWIKKIDQLDDLVQDLVKLTVPELAYRDAYDKMIEAMQEFGLAHYG
jgi:hypothetical protein